MLFYHESTGQNGIYRRATVLFSIIASELKKRGPPEGPVLDEASFCYQVSDGHLSLN